MKCPPDTPLCDNRSRIVARTTRVVRRRQEFTASPILPHVTTPVAWLSASLSSVRAARVGLAELLVHNGPHSIFRVGVFGDVARRKPLFERLEPLRRVNSRSTALPSAICGQIPQRRHNWPARTRR